MTDVFGRRYSLIIGRLEKELYKTVPWYEATRSDVVNSKSKPVVSGGTIIYDYRKEQEVFTRITDLDIRADVTYTKDASNKGGAQNTTIEIHNLSKETKARIREKDLVFLKAGYDQDIPENKDEESLPLIFSGEIISKTSTRKDDGTIVTVLICGDNKAPKTTLKVSESWVPGTGLYQVLNDLLDIAAANGVPRGKVFGVSDTGTPLAEEVYTYGYSVSGNLFNEIQKICDSIDYVFYISLGKIFIEPRTSRINSQRYDFISIVPESLKKPIEYISDGSTPEGQESREGIRVNIFLNGRATPEKYVAISEVDDEFNGAYRIKSIKHVLDFEGNDWDTIIECMKVD